MTCVPSVTEQLLGIRHILGEAIAPNVADPYASAILEGLRAALEGLADGWRNVPQFLRWDAEHSAAVLTGALPHLDPECADELRAALADTPDDDLDMVALEAHHRRVRALLERAVPAIVAHPQARALLVDHLRARVGRFPIATAPPAAPSPIGGPRAHPAR